MTIICMICDENVPEEKYAQHMATVHKGKSQLEGMNEEKLKKQNTPNIVPLQKDAPLPAEFEDVVKAIDSTPREEPRPTPAPPTAIPQAFIPNKPLELKYVWQGNCPQCSTPVRTVITKIDGRWFASAFCISHETIEQKEVHPLEVARLLHDDKVKEKEVENEQR